MLFKISKRCPYCAHKLVNDVCKNEKCIAYVADTAASTTEAASTTGDAGADNTVQTEEVHHE